LFTTIASAQKITNKDLQGNWTLLGFESGPIYFDLVKKDIVVPAELKAQIPPEADAQMRAALPMLEGSYMEVKDNKITMTLGPDGEDGTFVLTEKDGKQIMTITFEDTTTDDSEIFMKDKQLHLVQYTDGVKEAEFVYAKK
jgi:hypothetical protein